MKHYKVIVVGLGAMGSAALYQLSKASDGILGIDQFFPPHAQGSSGGETRIIRIANGEGEAYTPLILRANEIWQELERRSGKTLLIRNGGLLLATEDVQDNLFHGRPDFLGQTIEIAKKYGISHEVLSADDIRRRFPQFKLVGSETAYYELDAGYLLAEDCINTQLELAVKQGAQINKGEKVLEVIPDGDGVIVKTDKHTYSADKAVVSTGPWITSFVGDKYKDIFKVYRQVLYWWDVKGTADDFLPQNFPVFIWLFGKAGYYGFPTVHGAGSGVKIGFDYLESTSSPDELDRKVTDTETKLAYEKYIADRFPGLSDTCLKSAVCMITHTRDTDFIIDTLPDHPQIVIASPCNGGGFKHSAAIGQILSELALTGASSIPIEAFSLSRFKAA